MSGRAQSTDFPTTPGVFDPTNVFAADKGFVAKLNPAGSDLEYSTYLGGSVEDHCFAIAIDGAGNAFVTGYTWSSDFPTTPGAFDTSFDGDTDGFAAKLNATGSALEYSTFLGGASWEEGNGIALDGTGNAFVMGITYSSDFPTTPGAFDTSLGGSQDAFVTKLNASGSGLDYSTFLGGSSSETYGNFALDAAGRAFVTTTTLSNDFPTTPGAFDTSYNGSYDAVVAKLNASGSGLEYATYLGGANLEYSYAIALDGAGDCFRNRPNLFRRLPHHSGRFRSRLQRFRGCLRSQTGRLFWPANGSGADRFAGRKRRKPACRGLVGIGRAGAGVAGSHDLAQAKRQRPAGQVTRQRSRNKNR